ncbi:MAG: leucyl aminopeptidase [Methylophilaceae bacterium]|jgi:leucyl aminopeptidase|nr:leucyl aminopeptidase [Methylophilaceae bacterium]
MEFSIKSGNPERQQCDCLIIGVFEGKKLSASANLLDEVAEKAISSVVESGDMNGKLGSSLLIHQLPNVMAKRVLLVGLGKVSEFGIKQYLKVTRAAVKAIPTVAKDVGFYLTELAPVITVHQKTAQIVEVFSDATYQVNALKSKKPDAVALKKVAIFVEKSEEVEAKSALAQGLAISDGVKLAKDLGNLPGNVCTPTYLGEQAKQLAKDYGFKVEVLDRAQIEKLGMGAFLGVAQGSEEPMRLIVLQHKKGKKDQNPVALVGKGITFDTGGISLKGGSEMDEMKYDMCGAASVLGTFKAIGELDLPINAVGIIPTCDNMPSGKALKPGDIVTSMSGQTIEVLNTDAEGRLVLCDALTYAEKFDPSTVVDVATLTGACVVALGQHASAVYSNKDVIAAELIAAGEAAHDRAWHMPLWDDYQPQLDSNFADMANIGGRAAGSITAACFLSRFAKQYDWAHLDIAGTAWKSGKAKGGTGRPVPLLATFLIKRALG